MIALCCLAMFSDSMTSFAGEAEHTHRILGLFQKDREQDLQKVTEQLPGIELVEADYETGQAVFRYDAEAKFPGSQKPEQLAQSLSIQLRALSRGTFEVTPLTGRDRRKLTKVEIEILGLDCKGCSYGAYLAVHKLEGVENAIASFKVRKVTAWIDPGKSSRQTLEESLKKKRVKIVAKP